MFKNCALVSFVQKNVMYYDFFSVIEQLINFQGHLT